MKERINKMYNVIGSMAEMLNYDLTGVAPDLDFTEMEKLAEGLDSRGIEYTCKPLLGGEQIVVYDDNGDYLWDAVLHCGSYGHNLGLIEVMGESVVRVDFDNVEGDLTADEILARVDENRG